MNIEGVEQSPRLRCDTALPTPGVDLKCLTKKSPAAASASESGILLRGFVQVSG